MAENVIMAQIRNKKTYGRVSQTWIIEYRKMYKISDKAINIIRKALKEYQVELVARRQKQAEMKIQRGHLPERLTLTPFLWYSNDTSQLYT